jgi:hypothetical protein
MIGPRQRRTKSASLDRADTWSRTSRRRPARRLVNDDVSPVRWPIALRGGTWDGKLDMTDRSTPAGVT